MSFSSNGRFNSSENGERNVHENAGYFIQPDLSALKPSEEKKQALQLKPEKIDYLIKENEPLHHTADYDESVYGLVVRRGQEFQLEVTFDRAYDPEKDELILQLTFGSHPQESKNTLIRIKVKDDKNLPSSKWGMRIEKSNGKNVALAVMSPANALVGEYKVFMETKTKISGTGDEYLIFKKDAGKDETVIVLFNAWCQDDAVYMDNEEERQEYVLNPTGNIWKGSKEVGDPWNFGQFENVSLRTCLYVLDICRGLSNLSRGDPVLVSRFLTKMVNSTDPDGGILVGNWSGNYDPYKNPSYWTGSVKILEEYEKLTNKYHGVKYGQCWVFSGILTTLLRAIGIPTRSVTNFSSAHDTDASTTIDFHYKWDSVQGKWVVADEFNDSVWNFHVWNESFFKRADLPAGEYDGWQAIDATPQETSQGVYCCGPAPVKAIKEGLVYIPYDTRFVFGEVNGDRVFWTIDGKGEMKAYDINSSAVGKNISTKALGSKHRNDVTNHYKHDEGSAAERAAVHRAYKMSGRRDIEIYKINKNKDVVFAFVPQDAKLMIGSDFNVQWKMTNTSDQPRTIDVTIVTRAEFYTGINAVPLQKPDKLENVYRLQPREEKVVSLPVSANKYIGKAPADANIKAFFTVHVKETGQLFHDDEVITLKKPELTFEFGKDFKEKKTFEMTVSFMNPLKVQLENGVFNIETARYVSPDTITVPLKKPVQPQEKAAITVTLHVDPKGKGKKYVIANFSSSQIIGVGGRVDF